MSKIDIMICTKDRPTEVALLLQSLRTQTFQDFDIYIYDDRSGAPLQSHHFLNCVVNLLKQENHRVIIWRNEIHYGVTKLRQIMVERILEKGSGDSILRLDDDNILENDYIERLIKVLDQGYDIASGVVPVAYQPTMIRNPKFVKPFIADIELDSAGNIKNFGDECGNKYTEDCIIPSPHFRSMALIRKEVHKKVKYELNLGYCSFREEEFFSFKAIIAGFKIGVDTGAVAYHMITPSGGERTSDFRDNLDFNNNLLNKFTQKMFSKHGDFIADYKKKFEVEE